MYKLKESNEEDKDNFTTPICNMTLINTCILFYLKSQSLLFDQNPVIITFQAKKQLNKIFRAEFLCVATTVRSWKQSILNHHTKNIDIAIAQYEMENNSSLFNLLPYFAHTFARLDLPPI